MTQFNLTPAPPPAPKRRGRPPGSGGKKGSGGGSSAKKTNGATIGYEAELWQMADALRGSMDAAEYKHVALGLIFLKYISDAFEEQHERLLGQVAEGADPEDPDEYRAENIFWVPREARWAHLQASAKQPRLTYKFNPRTDGPTCRRARSSPPSGRPWMTPWTRSSGTTPSSRECSPETTPGRP